MYKPEQDIDFIKKRIEEQHQYYKELYSKYDKGIISRTRFDEIYPSALSQLRYFKKLKENYENK